MGIYRDFIFILKHKTPCKSGLFVSNVRRFPLWGTSAFPWEGHWMLFARSAVRWRFSSQHNAFNGRFLSSALCVGRPEDAILTAVLAAYRLTARANMCFAWFSIAEQGRIASLIGWIVLTVLYWVPRCLTNFNFFCLFDRLLDTIPTVFSVTPALLWVKIPRCPPSKRILPHF